MTATMQIVNSITQKNEYTHILSVLLLSTNIQDFQHVQKNLFYNIQIKWP